jgi:Transposase
MKNSKFYEQQFVAILKEVELGAEVGETCRKHGISDATYQLQSRFLKSAVIPPTLRGSNSSFLG